jgi:hypothetical protein
MAIFGTRDVKPGPSSLTRIMVEAMTSSPAARAAERMSLDKSRRRGGFCGWDIWSVLEFDVVRTRQTSPGSEEVVILAFVASLIASFVIFTGSPPPILSMRPP